MNKLLVNFCVDELEQTKAFDELEQTKLHCVTSLQCSYVPNRNCNQLPTSIMAMQTIKSH